MPPTSYSDSRPDGMESSRLATYLGWRPDIVLSSACALVGALALLPLFSMLMQMWLNEPLKSVGAVVPLVSFALVLRAWKSIGWELHGTWWGLAVIAGSLLLARFREQALLVLVITPHLANEIPPTALMIVGYATGVVLLFGGTRLLRASVFPLLLLFFVNPVPGIFTNAVDIPLQQASAYVARSFAVALGQPLNDASLKLMFTPSFGMFIAPGCNGIRGAVTLGLIAAVVGYLFRFRPTVHALVITGAVLLGYLCNFLRLCMLVLYYLVALHFPRLQKHGTGADYLIGGTIFLFATFLFVSTILKLKNSPRAIRAQSKGPAVGGGTKMPLWPRIVVFLAVVVVLGVAPVREALATPSRQVSAMLASPMDAMPKQIGEFRLMNAYVQHMIVDGAISYIWWDYAAEDGRRVSLGVNPNGGVHDPLFCHKAEGEFPAERIVGDIPTGGGELGAVSALYMRQSGPLLEVSTICNQGTCGAYGANPQHFGLIYSKVAPHAFFQPDPKRPIPVVLRASTSDNSLTSQEAYKQLSTEVEQFVAGVDMTAVTKNFR